MKKLKLSEFQFKLLLFLIPFIPMILNKPIDNDFWFTINQGNYILNHGFPTTVLFTIHNNLDFVYQSWGTGVVFYSIYKLFGTLGINILLIIIGEITVFIFYKTCFEISEEKEKSYFITAIAMSAYCMIYIATRPHIFTGLNLTILLYLLEKYTKTKNKKYLIPLPLISLLEVNMHGMYFFIMLIFTLPYIVDSFKINIFNIETTHHKRKSILTVFILMFLIGFINPYTYKTIFYVFTSFGNDLLKSTITELKPFNISEHTPMFIYMCIILILYYINKKEKIELRYFLLVIGSTILALESIKSFNFFLLGGIFPLTKVFGLKFQEFDNKKHNLIYYILNIIVLISIITLIIYNYTPNKIEDNKAIQYLKNNYTKNKSVYTEFYEGSYIEYLGFKCYIDPRAEAFLKVNNHKKDIYKEYIDLNNRRINYKKFLDTYNFDLLLVNKHNSMYKNLKEDNYKYKLVYNDKDYQLYEKASK